MRLRSGVIDGRSTGRGLGATMTKASDRAGLGWHRQRRGAVDGDSVGRGG